MLEIVNYNQDEYEFPCLLVLGCFDGMHAGHAELLKKAKLQAKINGLDLGVMMFSEGKGGKQVYAFEERLKFLEQYNVKFVLKIDFNEEFKATKPLDFLQALEDKLNVKAYMSGKDFRFGTGAKGKSSTLKNYAEDEDNGVWYMSIKDVTVNDEKISTTAIKKLLEDGEIALANELLGKSFSVSGTVEVNNGELYVAYPANKIEIKSGVYAVKCTVDGAEYTGTAAVGKVLNISLENLAEDISGKEITVEFTGLTQAFEQTAELAVASEPQETEEAPAEEVAAERTEENAENEAFEEELDEEFTEEPSVEEEVSPETQVEVAEEAPVEEEEITGELPAEEELSVEEIPVETENEEELPADAEVISEEVAESGQTEENTEEQLTDEPVDGNGEEQ